MKCKTEGNYFRAYKGNQEIGYITFSEKEDYIECKMVYVFPEKRGLGYGYLIFKEFVKIYEVKKIRTNCPVIQMYIKKTS